MKDSRIELLAKNIVNKSCKVKANEKVLIDFSGCDDYFVICLIREIKKVKAYPFIWEREPRIFKELQNYGKEEYYNMLSNFDYEVMNNMDVVIMVKGSENAFERIDNLKIKQMYDKLYYEKVHGKARLFKRWILLVWPTKAFSQLANMSTEEFEDFYFKVCNLDYLKMKKAMLNLEKLMNKTDKVKIVAKNTELTFSIKNIGVVKCYGENNIPDGEIYTAPVKNSINGYITFNIPVIYNGVEFNDICLHFENGKIVKFQTSNDKAFKNIIDTDSGSRYIGEFAFGVNPYIKEPVKDILFDEKMEKSIHMAIGACYSDANNSNKSAIHWDLIQSHSKKYGGGKIYFDDVLIRENGLFILPELVALNPENLV